MNKLKIKRTPDKVVFRTVVAKVKNDGLEFVLSDATPDRYDDIILTSGWELENFNKNPIALFGHMGSFPVGTWSKVRVEDNALRGFLNLAPEGTSDRIDEIRKLVDAGILVSVSVGFTPMAYEERKGDTYGLVYTQQELVECSLVSVPANPNALIVAKQLKISDATRKMVFGKHADERSETVRRSGPNGEHAETSSHVRRTTMGTIAERILAVQGKITALRDQYNTLIKDVDDDNPDEETSIKIEDVQTRLAIQERHLETLKKAEKSLAVKTAQHHDEEDTTVELTDENLRQRGSGGSSAASGVTVNNRRPFAVPGKKLKPVDFLFRALTVQLKHHHDKGRRSMVDVLKETYGDDEGTHTLMNVICRATAAPANTTTQGWAQELVTVAIGEFFGLLQPVSVYAQLINFGGRFTFGPNGILSLPTRSATPTIGGAFIGQGAPIPVKQGAFTAITMTPKKVGVISTFTREIAEHSTPSIEQLVRDAIVEDTANAVDSVLLDNNAATAIRPQGLQNAATPQTPDNSGSTALDKLILDIKLMTNGLFTSTNGNVRTPVWIMNPVVANNISLMTVSSIGNMPFRDEIAAGRLAGYPIIKSSNSAVDTWWLVDAADFISATGDTPRFDVSDQAVLHMEDTTPADVGTAGAIAGGSTKSLWQTDSIGVRMLMDLNWALRRTGMVQYMTGHNWE